MRLVLAVIKRNKYQTVKFVRVTSKVKISALLFVHHCQLKTLKVFCLRNLVQLLLFVSMSSRWQQHPLL